MQNENKSTYTPKQAAAAKKYLEKFDEIRIRLPKGQKDEIKRKAAAEGKSMNEYIKSRI